MNKNAYSTIYLHARRNAQMGIAMKKFWYKLFMIAAVLIMSLGFSITVFAYDEAEIISVTEEYLKSWNEADFQSYIDEGAAEPESLEQFKGWQETKSVLGEFVSIDSTTVTEGEGEVIAVLTATYSKSKLTFTIIYDAATIESHGTAYAAKNIDAQPGSSSSGDTSINEALLNTLMGMGTVFVVLIFMSFIISLMKYIPGLLDKLSGAGKKGTTEVIQSVDKVVASISTAEEELRDDSELVAVITAAIMASMGSEAPQGGLVVRNIRRRH